MKKLLALVIAGAVFFSSCQKSINDQTGLDNEEMMAPPKRSCGSYEMLQQQLKEDPSLQQRMIAIEEFTRNYQQNPNAYRLLANGTMEIPVVVNVLYRTAAENISDDQIESQIDVMNEDFSARNRDYNNTPELFQSVRSGDVNIKYVLENVVRKLTTKKSWPMNDAMKKSHHGGIDPTNPTTTLNIWVCNLGQSLLGYAQFPGGDPQTDGVVILYSAFGSRQKYPAGTYIIDYDLGRTATHEIGHYFNLRHIWGDSRCGNDLVDDTPLHNSYNFGCPSFPANSDCGGVVHPMMTMNYMDYTDDACMFMFTVGQKTRMQATYAIGGPRASLR